MRICAGLTFALALSFATKAFAAGVTVIGGGYGQECFKAAQTEQRPALGIQLCDKALDVDMLSRTDRAATHVNRGILKTRIRKAESAMKDYDTAIAIKPELPEIYVNRGATLILLSRFAEAVADLEKGMKMGLHEPKFAYYNRALAREYLDDLKGAYLDYKKALELDPEFPDALREIKRFTVVTVPKKS